MFFFYLSYVWLGFSGFDCGAAMVCLGFWFQVVMWFDNFILKTTCKVQQLK